MRRPYIGRLLSLDKAKLNFGQDTLMTLSYRNPPKTGQPETSRNQDLFSIVEWQVYHKYL